MKKPNPNNYDSNEEYEKQLAMYEDVEDERYERYEREKEFKNEQ